MHSVRSAYHGPATEPNKPGLARRSQPGARLERVPWHCSEAAHRQLTDGQAAQGCRPMLQGITWHGVVRSASRGRTTSRSTQRAAMVRRVARAEAASDWKTYGKVSTGRIHGPWYTCLARSKALDRS
jgi:hypothetical protein